MTPKVVHSSPDLPRPGQTIYAIFIFIFIVEPPYKFLKLVGIV